MEKIIVFDFDKTLTNYDTTFPFFLFCCKKKPLGFFLIPVFSFFMFLSKMKIISVKWEKEIGLKLFCRSDYSFYLKCCSNFSHKVTLNNVYSEFIEKKSSLGNRIILASASFNDYLNKIFPDVEIIGTTVLNEKGRIKGISRHPFGFDKREALIKAGIEKIDLFYTDSRNDICVSNMAKKTIWVANGRILNK
ncbi:MAG: haloacid dehalogenase-like hydrolase [Bacteroidales bacterium]|jgi:phosphoserine phosphatase|nr:haloacid dehalogenase-like hydrolase [Bacteroidales bacterium]